MNNDLRYTLQGILMVIVFFIAFKLFQYSLSLQFTSDSTSQTQIDSYNISTNSKGKQLFMQNCAACHAINKTLTGPPLAGVEERVADKKLLHEWINNNQQVLQSGNTYFLSLYKRYDQITMPLFPLLRDDEIDSILVYIKTASEPLPQPETIVI